MAAWRRYPYQAGFHGNQEYIGVSAFPGSQVDVAYSCKCRLRAVDTLQVGTWSPDSESRTLGFLPPLSFPCQLGSGGGWGRSLSYSFLFLGAGLFGAHCSLTQRGSDKLVVCGFWCQQEKLPPSFSLHPEAADAASLWTQQGLQRKELRLYLSHKGGIDGLWAGSGGQGQCQDSPGLARAV